MIDNKKIKILYFINLRPNKWKPIVEEQLNSLKNLDLYNYADEIYVSLISDKKEIIDFTNLLKTNYSKIQIKDVYTENVFEFAGFKTLYEIADEDSIILYFHTKGIFSGEKNNDNNKLRKLLFEHTIKNYDIYLKEFKKNENIDIGSMFPHMRGFAFYNFFWIRGSYIKKYCQTPVVSSNRFLLEEWIGNPHSKKNIIETFSPIIGHDKIIEKGKLIELKNKMLNMI